MNRLKIFVVATIMLFSASLGYAQEPAPSNPAQEQAQPEQNTETAADTKVNEAAQAPSNDPGDIITNYFNSMGDIIAQNMDNPKVLIDTFSVYLKDNEKQMRTASKNFEAKLASMKASEAEVYRETVQRKITPALNKLIVLLIDFQNRYPEDAAKLDSMLKVDAKYTYQQ